MKILRLALAAIYHWKCRQDAFRLMDKSIKSPKDPDITRLVIFNTMRAKFIDHCVHRSVLLNPMPAKDCWGCRMKEKKRLGI